MSDKIYKKRIKNQNERLLFIVKKIWIKKKYNGKLTGIDG